MKTAMEELLIDLMINLETEIGYRLNMEKFKPFLEKEKDQIMNDFEFGRISTGYPEIKPVDYYLERYFNQNK
jgi:hypothetical protein